MNIPRLQCLCLSFYNWYSSKEEMFVEIKQIRMKIWKSVSHIVILFVCVLAWPQYGQGLFAADVSVNNDLSQVQRAYGNSKFQEVLDQVAKLGKEEQRSNSVQRLKVLSLARLGKTKESIEAYDQVVKLTGRENEPLLRELAIAVILPFRADMREQIRGAAYTALKEIHSEDMVPLLEEGLGDGSGMIRALVAEGLAGLQTGQKSQRFRQVLKDKAGLVRANVLKGLGRSGDRSTRDLIRPLLEDEQVIVQVAAAGAMIKLGYQEFWKNIEKSAEKNEGYERGAAYRMLGELGDVRAIEILEKGLRDRQPSIRGAAAASLGKILRPEAVPYLLSALMDKSPAVRSIATVGLGKQKAEKAIPVLTNGLNDPNPGVRAASVAALLHLGNPFSLVAQTVSELMPDKNPGIRSAIAKALENGHGRDAIGTLFLLLKDPVPKPRITAARSLGRIGDRQILPRLKQALRDQDEAVRATVAAAIVRILSQPDKL